MSSEFFLRTLEVYKKPRIEEGNQMKWWQPWNAQKCGFCPELVERQEEGELKYRFINYS